ncbi:MAG TPA: hypothetical protein DDZ67_14495 [Xanthomonadaceae bacterium]|nr:hypothetical protein [Xanthomonadaceae bacterium]
MTMSDSADHPHACENCATQLQGGFCHRCGQSAHSPVRSFAHAVEEVFESFWHLDGRIFRTLRDLLVPGRVAAAYLAGKRMPYVAPMRLFVILSLLTFFVARLAVHMDAPAPSADGSATAAVPAKPAKDFRQARSVEEVEATRKAFVDNFGAARDAFPENMGAARRGMETAIGKVNAEADKRLAELRSAPDPNVAQTRDNIATAITPDDQPWNAQTNPVEVAWLPGLANRWLNRQIGRVQQNLPRLRDNPQLLFNAFFAAVPSVLFVLVPLFALMLRVFYIETGRLYLEHLVVAVYSHAFLCLDLLAILLLSLLGDALAGIAPWSGWLVGGAQTLLLLWMPVYLLLMQQRVYRQFWLVTLVKYGVLGWLYFSVVTFAAAALMIASLARF